MDCPTITVHAETYYKALTDSGAAILLIRYSTYQTIDSSFKTSVQTITTKLNTADGLVMMALGITALHLRIADFKFTHSFIICNQTQKYCLELMSRKKSLLYVWDKEKTATYKRMADFSLILKTVNRRQQ